MNKKTNVSTPQVSLKWPYDSFSGFGQWRWVLTRRLWLCRSDERVMKRGDTDIKVKLRRQSHCASYWYKSNTMLVSLVTRYTRASSLKEREQSKNKSGWLHSTRSPSRWPGWMNTHRRQQNTIFFAKTLLRFSQKKKGTHQKSVNNNNKQLSALYWKRSIKIHVRGSSAWKFIHPFIFPYACSWAPGHRGQLKTHPAAL